MLVPRGATAARVGTVTLGKGRDKGKGKGKGRQDDRDQAQEDQPEPEKESEQKTEKENKANKKKAVAKLMAMLMGDDEEEVETPKAKNTKTKQTETPSTAATSRTKDKEGDPEGESPYDAWAKKAAGPREPVYDRDRDRFSVKETRMGKPKWYFPPKAVKGEDEHGGLILKNRGETYARCELDWGGLYMRTIPEESLLDSMRSLQEDADCRVLGMAVTQAEANTMMEGGSAIILSGSTQCLQQIQNIMDQVHWDLEEHSVKVFGDMMARFVEWSGHGKNILRRDIRRLTPMDADIRKERDDMAKELEQMKKDMMQLRSMVNTGGTHYQFTTAADLLRQQGDGPQTPGQGTSPGIPPAQATPTNSTPGSGTWRKVTTKQDDQPGDWTAKIETNTTPVTPSRVASALKTRRKLTRSTVVNMKTVKKTEPRYVTRRAARSAEDDSCQADDVSMEDQEDLPQAADVAASFTQPWGPPVA